MYPDQLARRVEREGIRVTAPWHDLGLCGIRALYSARILRAAGIDAGYRLVLDTGTFHGLSSAQREVMGREIDAVAAADATVFLLAWEPKRRGPLPRGASRSEIEAAFPRWSVTDVGPSYFEAPKPVELLLTPDEHWYRLRCE